MYHAASSFCRIDLPLAQALPYLHTATSTTIEIFAEAPHFNLNGDWQPSAQLLTAYARTHGVSYALHAPCFDLNPAAANAGVRAEVERQYRTAIEAAAALDASHVVVHSGHRSDPRLDAQSAAAWTRELLERLVPVAEHAGVRLALENTGYGGAGLLERPQDLLKLIRDLPMSTVGLTLDIGHAALQRLDPVETIALWAPYLCNVHLHDNSGTDDDHFVPGRGQLDLHVWLEQLRLHGYEGPLTLESFLSGHTPTSLDDAWEIVDSL